MPTLSSPVVSLASSVVVVTGGATGIGRALALEAACRHARVFIGDVQDAQETVDMITAAGGQAAWLVCDMTNLVQVRALAQAAVERYGEVNVLCNNAGRAVRGILQDVNSIAARQLLELNILGSLHGIHAFAPLLAGAALAGRPAYLLNTGSEHSHGVPPHVRASSFYTASNYAILGLTETARRDLAPLKIGVSLLAPGWVLAENVRRLIDSSAEGAAAMRPYAQQPGLVAALAFDGLLASQTVIVTNPASVGFAMKHANELMAELQHLPRSGQDVHLSAGTSTICGPFSQA